MDDNLNLNKNGKTDPFDVAKKAQEAFREFELGEKIKQEQPQIISSANAEIEESLKEFDQKQQIETLLKDKRDKETAPPGMSKMVRFLIKHSRGLIKNEKQANSILLGIAGLIFLISGCLFFIGISGNSFGK